MRRSTLALAVIFLSGCSWLSTGLPTSDTGSSASSDAMMNDASSVSSKAMSDGVMMPKSDGAMAPKSESAMLKKESSSTAAAVIKNTGSYTVYRDGVIGNGETSVLFFHAAWCPYCQQGDKDLTQWYGSTGFPLTVYKVDYDTQTELKSRYGVTTQHTFVKIDGSGNAVKTIIGPSNAALQALLGA